MAKNELTVQEQRDLLANPVIQTIKTFETQQRMAQMYATSTIVPDTYRKNIGNCVIAIDMAMRMGVNPLAAMQNLYIVHGMPAWSTQFLVACVNKCGRFAPLEYEMVGDDPSKKSYKCRAFTYAVEDVKKERPLYGTWITWAMVDGEGWSKKSGSKWLTMPEQMFRYRAASFWARTYAPEISMGFPTQEDAMDGAVIDVEAEPVDDKTVGLDDLSGEVNDEDWDKKEVKEEPATPAQAIRQAIEKQAEQAVNGAKPAADAAKQETADNANKAGDGTIFGNQQQ